MNIAADRPPHMKVMGSKVHLLQMSEVLGRIECWIQERGATRYIVATGMHGVMEAHRDPEFKEIVNSADLFVPDGISLVWIGRVRGYSIRKRVSGSDLMTEFFKLAAEKGYKVYFYGDTDETLNLLQSTLKEKLPNLQIAGAYSPPFRPLSDEEDREIVKAINGSGADVLWVGLGLPKQERWLFEHRDKINVPVAVGVGAAFKFQSGQVRRAPRWIGELGFEWLWRFCREPKRVWRRVLLDGPRFAGNVILEMSKLKKFE
ncbi:MAG: hypothetical protein BZY88_00650 [SAR202 cluster bacterium Io17-Chloro-G9]|nr:MAG: hypothetical protein BZY88_00650 [SAR202 cluster bacterium Io17-Chloro-G9]